MNRSNLAGTALRLLCLPIALAALASCERNQTSQGPAPETFQRPAPDGGQKEINELIEATKHHPSLQAGSNEAGAPINVNPYPQSAGMTHDEHGGHDMAKPKTKPSSEPKPEQ